MKNVAILEMPHGVYRTDLPAETQATMLALGVEEIPSVMPGSLPVDGKCLIQLLVNYGVLPSALNALGLPGVSLIGYWDWQGVALSAFNVARYDVFISPVVEYDEAGEEVCSTPAPSGKCTSLFSGQAVPEGMV